MPPLLPVVSYCLRVLVKGRQLAAATTTTTVWVWVVVGHHLTLVYLVEGLAVEGIVVATFDLNWPISFY